MARADLHESVKAEVDCSLSVIYKEDPFQLYLKDKEGMSVEVKTSYERV